MQWNQRIYIPKYSKLASQYRKKHKEVKEPQALFLVLSSRRPFFSHCASRSLAARPPRTSQRPAGWGSSAGCRTCRRRRRTRTRTGFSNAQETSCKAWTWFHPIYLEVSEAGVSFSKVEIEAMAKAARIFIDNKGIAGMTSGGRESQ